MDGVMAPRLSAVTLGVEDMARARAYYGSVFEPMDPPDRPGPCYVRLPGTWLALYPRDALARYAESLGAAFQPGLAGSPSAQVSASSEIYTTDLWNSHL